MTWARKQAGLTKTAVAQALGVSLSLISEIEAGTRNATPENINRLAGVFNCPRVVLENKVAADSGAHTAPTRAVD